MPYRSAMLKPICADCIVGRWLVRRYIHCGGTAMHVRGGINPINPWARACDSISSCWLIYIHFSKQQAALVGVVNARDPSCRRSVYSSIYSSAGRLRIGTRGGYHNHAGRQRRNGAFQPQAVDQLAAHSTRSRCILSIKYAYIHT